MAFHIHNLFARNVQHLRTILDRVCILDDIGQYAVHGSLERLRGIWLEQITGRTDFKAVRCKIQRSGTKYDRALVADLTQTACYINAERWVHQNIQQNNIKPSAVPKLIIERFTAVVHFAGIVNRMCIAVMTEKIRKDIPF